jgi:hypothetical protein
MGRPDSNTVCMNGVSSLSSSDIATYESQPCDLMAGNIKSVILRSVGGIAPRQYVSGAPSRGIVEFAETCL